MEPARSRIPRKTRRERILETYDGMEPVDLLAGYQEPTKPRRRSGKTILAEVARCSNCASASKPATAMNQAQQQMAAGKAGIGGAQQAQA